MSTQDTLTETSPSTSTPTPTTTAAPSSLTPEQALQREKKIQTLTSKITTLTSQISTLSTDLSTTNEKLSPFLQNNTPQQTTPQAIVQRHIRLLHEYNEIKDIAQGLMGMIADGRGLGILLCSGSLGLEGMIRLYLEL